MKSIALIHTVKSVAVNFDQMLHRGIRTDLAIHNLWDDYPVDDPNEKGGFTADNRNHLLLDIEVQELTGADLIVIACSTLTPTVEMVRSFIKAPVIAIDDAMAKASVTYDGQVPVMATVGSTVRPIASRIEREGETAGKKLSIDTCVCAQVPQTLKATDVERYDRTLMEKVKESTGYDYIALTQVSMTHLEYETAAATGHPILTSPRLCAEEIKQKLASLC